MVMFTAIFVLLTLLVNAPMLPKVLVLGWNHHGYSPMVPAQHTCSVALAAPPDGLLEPKSAAHCSVLVLTATTEHQAAMQHTISSPAEHPLSYAKAVRTGPRTRLLGVR